MVFSNSSTVPIERLTDNPANVYSGNQMVANPIAVAAHKKDRFRKWCPTQINVIRRISQTKPKNNIVRSTIIPNDNPIPLNI